MLPFLVILSGNAGSAKHHNSWSIYDTGNVHTCEIAADAHHTESDRGWDIRGVSGCAYARKRHSLVAQRVDESDFCEKIALFHFGASRKLPKSSVDTFETM